MEVQKERKVTGDEKNEKNENLEGYVALVDDKWFQRQ